MRMEVIPTTLVLHRRADGADTRMAYICPLFVTNPLEQWIRATSEGWYRQAPVAAAWDFKRISDICQEEV